MRSSALVNAGRGLGRLAPWYAAPRRWLDLDEILSRVRRRTGGEDLDDPGVLPELRQWLHAVARRDLHFVGTVLVRWTAVRIVEQQMLLAALRAATPAIEIVPHRPPIVITGLPRSGTTFLHHLLSGDPSSRTLAQWESVQPIAYAQAGIRRREERRVRTRLNRWRSRLVAPWHSRQHEVRFDGGGESVLLWTWLVGGLAAPLFTDDPRLMTAVMARSAEGLVDRHLLQLAAIEPAHSARRWVLRDTSYLLHLDDLIRRMPRLGIVQVYRDPVATVASYCNMVLSYRSTVMERVEPSAIGPEICELLGQLADRSVAIAERYPQIARADLAYDDLIADPSATIARTYSALGLELGAEMYNHVQREIARAEGRQRWAGGLALRDFGLAADQVRERFASYSSRFHGQRQGRIATRAEPVGAAR